MPEVVMRIVISGASGLIGSCLIRELPGLDPSVKCERLVRRPAGTATAPDEIAWDPGQGRIEPGRLEGADVVIHLAAAGIASRRWSARYKDEILFSRVAGTETLTRALAGLNRPPRLLITASAVGYYGSRPPEETVDESHRPGEGFLSRVCQAWESAADPARDAGIRVVHLRFGMALSPAGGALARLLPVFRLGLGGRIGDGRQPVPWIALEEIPRIVLHLAGSGELDGPVNAVAPEVPDNAGWTRTLARVLRRPAVLPVPALALRLLFGEMAGEALLGGARVRPRRLLESGYAFRWPALEPALRAMLSAKR
jgi:uncharacterized protein (TIGR01777 family)